MEDIDRGDDYDHDDDQDEDVLQVAGARRAPAHGEGHVRRADRAVKSAPQRASDVEERSVGVKRPPSPGPVNVDCASGEFIANLQRWSPAGVLARLGPGEHARVASAAADARAPAALAAAGRAAGRLDPTKTRSSPTRSAASPASTPSSRGCQARAR